MVANREYAYEFETFSADANIYVEYAGNPYKSCCLLFANVLFFSNVLFLLGFFEKVLSQHFFIQINELVYFWR